MTIAATTRIDQYTGNGAATNFAVNFEFFNSSDLRVVHRASNGTETVLTETTDYAVNGGGAGGATGSIDFPEVGSSFSTLAANETLTITDGKDTERDTNMTASYQFTTLNLTEDKTMTMLQNLLVEVNRCIKFAESDLASLDSRLPIDTDRASSYLFFDENGEVTTVANSSQSAIPSVSHEVTAPDGDVTTGDGVSSITVPISANGMNLIYAAATVITAGVTGSTTIQIHNLDRAGGGVDMLSTKISIAAGATQSALGIVNTAYDNVVTLNRLRIDVDTVSATAPKGLVIVLGFQLPSS